MDWGRTAGGGKIELAHDLLKSIGVIAVLAARLRGELDQPEHARRDSQRLQSISEDLLEFLRAVLEEGTARGGNTAACAVDRAVWAAVRAVGLRQPARRIEVRMMPGLPMVRGGDVVLRRIVENLLDNALAASPCGRKVVVETAVLRGRVRIEVADSGCGFPGPTVDQFGASAHAARRPGHGIGLPASRRAVEAMGGSLTLLRTDRGTVARVVLPGCE